MICCINMTIGKEYLRPGIYWNYSGYGWKNCFGVRGLCLCFTIGRAS